AFAATSWFLGGSARRCQPRGAALLLPLVPRVWGRAARPAGRKAGCAVPRPARTAQRPLRLLRALARLRRSGEAARRVAQAEAGLVPMPKGSTNNAWRPSRRRWPTIRRSNTESRNSDGG